MKRTVLSAFLILGMTVPMATPAQAIFGLSTCEKVKKAIATEEKVGLEIWKVFDRERRKVLSSSFSTWGDLIEIVKLTPQMVDSDMRILKMADANSSCFTSKEIASVRKGISEAKRNSKNISLIIQNDIKNPSMGNDILTSLQRQQLRDLSKKYQKPF